jgi:cytochrome oxidase assembly protein ShyY1
VRDVYRFLLAPRWLALHAFLVVVLVAFGVLGWWQLESARHNERERQERAKDVAVALATVAEPGLAQSEGLAGQLVTVSGVYDGEAQLLVPGRERAGTVGFYVLTPLRTPDGGVIAVNRGWVAAEDEAAAARAAGGQVEVSGLLQPSEPPRAAAGAAREAVALPEGQIGYIATAQLTGRLPYPPSELYDGFLLLSEQRPAAEPAPVPVPETAVTKTSGVGSLRNLSYALQWWIFAAAAVFFWFSFVRHAAADRRASAEAPGDGTAAVQPADDRSAVQRS